MLIFFSGGKHEKQFNKKKYDSTLVQNIQVSASTLKSNFTLQHNNYPECIQIRKGMNSTKEGQSFKSFKRSKLSLSADLT